MLVPNRSFSQFYYTFKYSYNAIKRDVSRPINPKIVYSFLLCKPNFIAANYSKFRFIFSFNFYALYFGSNYWSGYLSLVNICFYFISSELSPLKLIDTCSS